MYKRICSFVVILALLLGLSVFAIGCAGTSRDQYTLYYTNSSATIIMEYSYEPKASDITTLSTELFNEMKNVSISNAYSVVPSGVELEETRLDGDIVNLYITGNVNKTTNNERIVFVSSLTKAISAIPEVSGVRIMHDGENVADGLGEYIDILKPNNFVNNANEDGDDYINSTITVYYADEDRDSLIKAYEDVSYRSTTQIERVVIEKIIEGPSEKGLNRTVSDKLILLNVSTRDGVCYVDFSKELISDPVSSYDQVPIYSIVNSLCELPNINSVQISINGDTNASMPRGEISLASTFSFNSEIVIR